MLRQVTLSQIPVGKNFTVWDEEFTVLKQDEDKVFVLGTRCAARMPFSDGSQSEIAYNDFRNSSVREHLNGVYIDRLVRAGADRNKDVLPLTINLECTMRQHEYGTDTVQAGLLTLEQYGEFYDIIPPMYGFTTWLLATPVATPTYTFIPGRCSSVENMAEYIYAVDHLRNIITVKHCRKLDIRPALNLNPKLLVMYEDEFIGEGSECWDKYVDYLRKWTAEHSGKEFIGCSPACFVDWLECEY